MRQCDCPAIRELIWVGGILLLALRSAYAQEPAASPDVPRPPITDCAGGGERYRPAYQDYERGRQLAAAGDPRCVDFYFSSARQSWQDLSDGLSLPAPRLYRGTLNLYNAAVFSCVVSGHRLGRLDPEAGLKIWKETGWQTIPVVGVGLKWRLEQIDCFRPAATCFQNPCFASTVTYGVGSALLGIHYRRPNVPGDEHYLQQHPIALTAVLKSDGGNVRLELHNPIRSHTLQIAGRELWLSRNIAAAIEFLVTELEAEVNPWSAFFNPEIALDYEGTLLLEPYQPGKIPVVLVHGLLSNPATWGTMINDFWNNPALMERFQIWAYLYPTSVPMIETASELRQDLRRTLAFCDPAGQDDALQQMVLVGHSMGGLLSRLQVIWSGNHLWNEFSNIPFNQVRGSQQLRRNLAEVFFFGPQPFVKRVVFIAVPHQGSAFSSRLLGLIGRLLAGRPTTLQTFWTELTRLNPGILRAWFGTGLPSSVDGLAPDSPTIRAISRMPFAPWVRRHSIIGTGGCRPCCPGDGVVSIESARLPGVDSELFVDETHSELNEHPQTIREVERILWLHWSAYEQAQPEEIPTLSRAIEVPSPPIIVPSPR